MPSIASCASVTPSPSVSLFNGSVILPFGFAGVDGLSTPVFSSSLVNPSPSQSAFFQVVLVSTVWLVNLNEHESFGSVPSIFSLLFVTPSPSQSASFHAALGVSV